MMPKELQRVRFVSTTPQSERVPGCTTYSFVRKDNVSGECT